MSQPGFFFLKRKKEKRFYTQERASCHQFNDTTGFFDLFLRFFTHIPSPDDHRNTRETTLAEKLCVSEREKVKYGSSVCWRLSVEILGSGFFRNEGPKLFVMLGMGFSRDMDMRVREGLPCLYSELASTGDCGGGENASCRPKCVRRQFIAQAFT